MRKMLIGATAAALMTALVPPAALAGPGEYPVSSCQALPVGTPGVSVLGQRIPSATDVTACISATTTADAVPAVVHQPECGNPCFSVEIHGLRVSEDVRIAVRFKIDGQQREIVHQTGPVSANPSPTSNLCVIGVGTPDPCTDRVTTPGRLTAVAKASRSASRIDLAWAASKGTRRSTVVGYQVWRSVTGEAGTFEQIATSTTTTYADSAITPGTTYWYYVIAWDDGGRYSPASNTASATAK
jgi:hypothetical protein